MWLDMVRGCYRSILVICRQDSVRVWTFQRQWLTSGFRQATLLTEPDDIMRNNGPGVPPSNQIVVKHSNGTYQPFSSMMLPAINFCLYGISMIFPWFSHISHFLYGIFVKMSMVDGESSLAKPPFPGQDQPEPRIQESAKRRAQRLAPQFLWNGQVYL